MAFTALPPSKRGGNRPPTNDVCVGCFKNGTNTVHTSISIPRGILREAGLPDYPGATFEVMVGEGADRGSVAIVAGATFRAQKVGTGQTVHRLAVGTSRLAAAAMPTRVVTYEVGRKQLIIHMPAEFAFRQSYVEPERVAA